MANFSINQVRHLYVANSIGTVNASSAKGTIELKNTADEKAIYFKYMSPGGQVRSDLIAKDKVLSYNFTEASKMAHPLRTVIVTLDPNVGIVAGEEYITRITFRQYIGLSEENQNFKYGYVKPTSGMTESDFYLAMAKSIASNVAKDTTPLLKVGVTTGSDFVALDGASTGASYTGVILEEAVQDWNLGTMPQAYIAFEAQPTTIVLNGDDVIWGTATNGTPINTVPNGHDIADLEYFCMGARGDHYRMMGYPNIIKTEYLVDPEAAYDVIDIHYAFTDSNESVQKSEKTITIVGKTGSLTTLKNTLDSVIG